MRSICCFALCRSKSVKCTAGAKRGSDSRRRIPIDLIQTLSAAVPNIPCDLDGHIPQAETGYSQRERGVFDLPYGSPAKRTPLRLCILSGEKHEHHQGIFFGGVFCRRELSKASLYTREPYLRSFSTDSGFGLLPDLAQWTATRHACPGHERRGQAKIQPAVEHAQ